jgi:hypothetical protein
MITSYSSFNGNPFSLRENVTARLGMKEFSNLFDNTLFESSSDNLLLEKVYSTYELGLLYENRKDWFGDNKQIYALESGDQCILFKNNTLFLVSSSTYKILNEQLSWDNVESIWNSTKEKAKESINAIADANKQIFDVVSDGAKKAWEFSKRVAITVIDFAKHDPLTAGAIFLQLMSAITAFIPGIGQGVGPVLLALAGTLDIVGGTISIREAWDKFSTIQAVKGSAGSIPAKATSSFSAGAPQLVSGCVSILLGLNDVVSCPKAALPGVGATSTALRGASERWSKTMVAEIARSSEHFLAETASKATFKLGPAIAEGAGKLMGKGGSGLAATAVSIIMVKVGKSILGNLIELVLGGMAGITTGISFLLSLPTKAAEGLRKLIAAAESPIAKLLIIPLEKIIEPLVRALGKLLDVHVKPMIDGFKIYIKAIIDNRKVLEEFVKSSEIEGGEQLVKSQTSQVKPKNAQVSKEDISKIKQIDKSVKKNESFDHIRGFEDFSLI